MDNKNTIPLLQLDGHINTYSGKKLNLLDPQPEQICIRDIARGLSYNSHFGGQTPKFFSIAQHCLLVCELMEPNLGNNPNLMMLGLLHDASEAYLGDMLKPLKVMLPEFQKIENHMMSVILKKYSLDVEMLPIIKEADKLAQRLEYEAFYKNGPMRYWSPDAARLKFMNHFYIYLNQREWHLSENLEENS